MAKVKYNYKFATCEVLVLKDKASGETEERVITLPHIVKTSNSRTTARMLKEMNDGGYLAPDEEAIYIKSVTNGVKTLVASLKDFLSIATCEESIEAGEVDEADEIANTEMEVE